MGVDEFAQGGVGHIIEAEWFVAADQREVAATTIGGDLVDGIHQGIMPQTPGASTAARRSAIHHRSAAKG